MSIIKSLESKLEELEKKYKDGSITYHEVIELGRSHLKKILKEASFEERKQFFKYLERDKKLEELGIK